MTKKYLKKQDFSRSQVKDQSPRADPGFEVRGGANGLENFENRGGGYCIEIKIR